MRINNYEATHHVIFSTLVLLRHFYTYSLSPAPCSYTLSFLQHPVPKHRHTLSFLQHPVPKHRHTLSSPNYATPSFTRNHQILTKF